METQKTPNSQSNLEKEKRRRSNQAPGLQTILQSYSNQDRMVLAQKQKYRSMEQDRKPRGKLTHAFKMGVGDGDRELYLQRNKNEIAVIDIK